ncbi:MAG: glycosyltransferase family 9 protein [Candidatus Omnitrophica bacterium]|nr:glycosyltransferase family 9 protein [Candidatus Omnitrophota bacterium]
MKIVTFAPEEIGDTIMATPLYAALRRLYSGATLDVISERDNHPVLKGIDLFDHTIVFTDGLDLSEYDMAVMPVFSCTEALQERARKAKRYIELRHLYPITPRHWKKKITAAYRHMLFEKHQVELNMELARHIGYTGDIPELYCPGPSQVLFAEHKGKIGCCIYTPQTEFQAKKNRNWPLHHWQALIEQLDKENVVATGAACDRPNIERIVSLTGCSYQITATIQEFVGLCRQLKVLITTDHGAMHIAATSGVPIISLHGTSSPVLLHPWVGSKGKSISIISPKSCSPCQRSYRLRLCEKGMTKQTCMEKILPKHVLNALSMEDSVPVGTSMIMAGRKLMSIEEFRNSWSTQLKHFANIGFSREMIRIMKFFDKNA